MNIMRTKGFKTLKKYWKPILLIVLLLLLFFPINCNGVFYYKGIRGCNNLLIEGSENDNGGDNGEEDSDQNCDFLICSDGSKGITVNDNGKNTKKRDNWTKSCLRTQAHYHEIYYKGKNYVIQDTDLNRWLPKIEYNDNGDFIGSTEPSSTDPYNAPQNPVMQYICQYFDPGKCPEGQGSQSKLLSILSDMCVDYAENFIKLDIPISKGDTVHPEACQNGTLYDVDKPSILQCINASGSTLRSFDCDSGDGTWVENGNNSFKCIGGDTPQQTPPPQ